MRSRYSLPRFALAPNEKHGRQIQQSDSDKRPYQTMSRNNQEARKQNQRDFERHEQSGYQSDREPHIWTSILAELRHRRLAPDQSSRPSAFTSQSPARCRSEELPI